MQTHYSLNLKIHMFIHDAIKMQHAKKIDNLFYASITLHNRMRKIQMFYVSNMATRVVSNLGGQFTVKSLI